MATWSASWSIALVQPQFTWPDWFTGHWPGSLDLPFRNRGEMSNRWKELWEWRWNGSYIQITLVSRETPSSKAKTTHRKRYNGMKFVIRSHTGFSASLERHPVNYYAVHCRNCWYFSASTCICQYIKCWPCRIPSMFSVPGNLHTIGGSLYGIENVNAIKFNVCSNWFLLRENKMITWRESITPISYIDDGRHQGIGGVRFKIDDAENLGNGIKVISAMNLICFPFEIFFKEPVFQCLTKITYLALFCASQFHYLRHKFRKAKKRISINSQSLFLYNC